MATSLLYVNIYTFFFLPLCGDLAAEIIHRTSPDTVKLNKLEIFFQISALDHPSSA